eukprot:1136619-Pelagomonas_calceolata.AAC.9
MQGCHVLYLARTCALKVAFSSSNLLTMALRNSTYTSSIYFVHEVADTLCTREHESLQMCEALCVPARRLLSKS